MANADSEKVTLVNAGIQSYGNYGEEFAASWPAPCPLFIGLLLRNLKRALDTIVQAQK